MFFSMLKQTEISNELIAITERYKEDSINSFMNKCNELIGQLVSFEDNADNLAPFKRSTQNAMKAVSKVQRDLAKLQKKFTVNLPDVNEQRINMIATMLRWTYGNIGKLSIDDTRCIDQCLSKFFEGKAEKADFVNSFKVFLKAMGREIPEDTPLTQCWGVLMEDAFPEQETSEEGTEGEEGGEAVVNSIDEAYPEE